MQDHIWAEQICSETPDLNLLGLLVTLYLQSSIRDYSVQVSKLIINHVDSLDIVNLVHTLPPNWSLGLLTIILSSKFKKLAREKFGAKLKLSIKKSAHSSLKQTLYTVQNVSAILIQHSTKCVICGLPISIYSFSLGANGLFHQTCR